MGLNTREILISQRGLVAPAYVTKTSPKSSNRANLKLKAIHKCFFSAPKKADLNAKLHCIARNSGAQERATFTKQVKRYIYGSKPCSRIGKQTTNYSKQCGDSTQADVWLCIGSWRSIALLMVRFNRIATSQVFVKV